MNKNEVIKLIGKENIEDFSKFIAGQTVGFEKGQVDYYEWDVKKFMRLKNIRRC
jgi:hypothetical protein